MPHLTTGPACPTAAAKLLTRLQGHTAAVAALAFSPDRRLLVSGGRDGSGRVWDIAGRAAPERAAFRMLGSGIRCLAFSPNGRVLAAGSAIGSVTLFDVSDAAAKEIRVLRGGRGAIDALAFSPDGKLLAGGGEDQTLRVWEPGAGAGAEARTMLAGHTGPIRAVAFAPDGQTLVTGSQDATARVWILSRIRSSQRAALTHPDGIDAVACSRDGRTLVTAASDGVIRLWELTGIRAMPRVELTGHAGGARVVLVVPDAETLVSAGTAGPALNWDGRTGRPVRAWELPADPSSSVALTQDGRYLARGLADGAVEVYRIAEKRT